MLHRYSWSLDLRTEFFLTPANEAEYMMALQFLEERTAVINQHINGVLRGFSLLIYNNVSAPPSALPVRILYQKQQLSPIFLAQKETYAYLCSANKTIVVYPVEQRSLLSADCVGFFYAHNRTYMAVAIP